MNYWQHSPSIRSAILINGGSIRYYQGCLPHITSDIYRTLKDSKRYWILPRICYMFRRCYWEYEVGWYRVHTRGAWRWCFTSH